ncbi:hypothetical protein [Streptomyces sp. TRM64462]|uniref:hypothetical protein n=1 Tax=Streptomyces sp. TRM64462 TaxID=2741726 RepID=UPI001586BB50|nr:hypothetical protein [Streptomyces sp. TRM64462]
MKRLLLLMFAATALLIGTTVPAQAQAQSDDWHQISGWSGLANKRTTGWFSYPVTEVYQAQGWGRVDWSGTTVEVHAGAYDLAKDGWCAVTEIRYKVNTGGGWSGWQYRSPAVDCTHDDDKQVISKYYRGNYPIKDLHFRVCLGWRDGATFECTDWR